MAPFFYSTLDLTFIGKAAAMARIHVRTNRMRARQSGLAGFVLAAVATLAWAAISFDPSSGVGTIGRSDVITYIGKADLVTSPTVTFEQSVTLSQNCSKVSNNVPKQSTATMMFQRRRLVAAEAQVPAPGKDITGYLLKGYTGDANPLPAEICTRTSIQGELGWMPAGPLSSSPAGQGLLTFNGKAIPY